MDRKNNENSAKLIRHSELTVPPQFLFHCLLLVKILIRTTLMLFQNSLSCILVQKVQIVGHGQIYSQQYAGWQFKAAIFFLKVSIIIIQLQIQLVRSLENGKMIKLTIIQTFIQILVMSVMRIKEKVVPSTWNLQKDLQSTTHSHRPNPSQQISDFSMKNLRVPLTQSHIHHSKHKQNRQQQQNTKERTQRNYSTSGGYLAPNTPTSFSIINDKNMRRSVETTAFDCGTSSSHSTPRSKSKSKHSIDKKTINNLGETDTVQSKFIISATPNQVLQQSEIVFKGSRDVGKIMPLKLVYQQQISKSIIEQLTASTQQQTQYNIQFNLIKKSCQNISIININNSSLVLSLIQLHQSYILDYLCPPNILKTFTKKKIDKNTYYFGQPYQYTLGQLIKWDKIDEKGIQIIWKHLQPVIKLLCTDRCSFFQVEGIQNNIFYVHGMFKMLPVFKKGKVQAMKNYGVVKQQIINYLLDLIYLEKQ